MLTVSLTIFDNAKASKLLDLLKELPFVEITGCQEISSQDLDELTAIYRRYAAQLDKSAQVFNVPGQQLDVSINNAISKGVMNNYGKERLMPILTQLAADPKPVEAIELSIDGVNVYCRFINGFRVLYRLGKDAWTGRTSISILHLVQLA